MARLNSWGNMLCWRVMLVLLLLAVVAGQHRNISKAMRDALDQTVSQDTTSHNKVDLDRVASVLSEALERHSVATEAAQSDDTLGQKRRPAST